MPTSNVIQCQQCGLRADVTAVFQHYGFRLTVPCACGATVRTGLELDDLPRYRVDFEASTPAQLRAGTPVTRRFCRHPDVAIDENTPLWALMPLRRRRRIVKHARTPDR
jgi:hypothetical protein